MLLRSWPLDANPIDPDQSNVPETFWRSGSISAGAGSMVLGFCFPVLLSLRLLATCTYIFATWTHMHAKFLAKIPKKLPYVSWYILIVLWCFHTLKWIKSMCVNFFIGFTCFNDFCEFSCTILDPIFALWCWYLIYDFCDVFISEFLLFLHSCMPNC